MLMLAHTKDASDCVIRCRRSRLTMGESGYREDVKEPTVILSVTLDLD